MSGLDRLAAALADRYRIERELGAGGMATVYLADDLRHHRKVAIKVLRPELAVVIGAERFLSEIRTTANLQHPHILALFDSGEADSFLFYVMPFIEGETLRNRLDREKQLPVADAVRVATEVASALDYAHRHHVIHRDIKPENILLHDGRALVADFGIALAASKAGGGRMTETGMSLGTPHYMSPEQAMGEREITARSDVYALGCVTYEMLVGEPPFTGPTAQAIMAKVMTSEPAALTAQRRSIPAAVEAAVFTALEKLPADRFATAAEYSAALVSQVPVHARAAAPAARAIGRMGWIAIPAVAALALVAGLLLGRRSGGTAAPAADDVVHATLELGDSVGVRPISNLRLALSPSGRRLVFVGSSGGASALWLRSFDDPIPRPLGETVGGFAPFFSPDGNSVGFFVVENGGTRLKVVGVDGGVPRTLVADSIANFGGGDWGDDGNIYFTNSARGLSRVAATGGAVTRISKAAGAGVKEHDFPDVLPGSRYALVMLWKGSIVSNRVGLIDLSSGAVTDLASGSVGRYVAPGFLVIGTADGRLLGARFDARAGRMLGTPVPIVAGVETENTNGTIQFALSTTGTLVYLPNAAGFGGPVWVDRAGAKVPVDTAFDGNLKDVALSPDGRRIALARAEAGETAIWVKDVASGVLSRVSADVNGADRPVWTPDGRHVAFLATRDGLRTAWMRRADGSDAVRRVVPGSRGLDEVTFDPTGRYVLLRSEGADAGSRKLLVFEIGRDSVPRVLIDSRVDHYAVNVSPDGKWIAYVSEESGSPQVYVRPFPNVDSARIAISSAGGFEPLWRRDGRELFFRDPRGGMVAVAIASGAGFEPSAPKMLFAGAGLALQDFYRSYDVTPDGKRFLMVQSGGVDVGSLTVVLNWVSQLQKLEAAE